MLRWEPGAIPVIVEAGEYDGQERLAIGATSHATIPQSRANRIVDGWIELLSGAPTGIRHLDLRGRIPARLFDSLRGQTQLEVLTVGGGDYADLTVLSRMRQLHTLSLGGATSVTSVDALIALPALRHLSIAGAKRLTDLSPLGSLHDLESLTINESINGPRQHVDSLEFVRGLTNVKRFFFLPIADSLDYSPLLTLTRATQVEVKYPRGMTPSALDLEWAIPGIANVISERSAPVETQVISKRFWEEEPPNRSELLAFYAEADAVWTSLLDGRGTRLETLAWGRDIRWWPIHLLQDLIEQFAVLLGQPWVHPPDKEILAIARWLEEWRGAVQQYRVDPDGEARRSAIREVRRLVAKRSPSARSAFESYLKSGVMGPDDEELLRG